MAPTAEQIARLRRMVAEPTEATYDDEACTALLEEYAVLDWLGKEPVVIDRQVAGGPPVVISNPLWTPTYDMHAAAARIWHEKAAAWIERYSFTDSGQSFDRNQVYQNMMQRAKFHEARRNPRTLEQHAWSGRDRKMPSYIVNAPEDL
jgi:hypothetical protein